MILIYGKVPGSFEICPGKVGNFLSSCREVKSARSGNTAPNAEHNLSTLNIQSGRRRGSMSGHSPWFFVLGIIVVDPFFIASQCDVKTPSDSVLGSYPWLWGVSKWLVESYSMILPILLALGTSLQQIFDLLIPTSTCCCSHLSKNDGSKVVHPIFF